jgi:hypothetical protein
VPTSPAISTTAEPAALNALAEKTALAENASAHPNLPIVEASVSIPKLTSITAEIAIKNANPVKFALLEPVRCPAKPDWIIAPASVSTSKPTAITAEIAVNHVPPDKSATPELALCHAKLG